MALHGSFRELRETKEQNVVLETTATSKTDMLDSLVEAHRKDLEKVFEEKKQMQAKSEVGAMRTPHPIMFRV